MGFRKRNIFSIMLYKGIFIGIFGTSLGYILGVVVCILQNNIQFIDSLTGL